MTELGAPAPAYAQTEDQPAGLPGPEPARPVLLTRDLILKADDIQTREVEVPEWGGTVLIRALTGTERDAYEAEAYRLWAIKQQGK